MNKIENETDKQEQIERGKRIKQIREDELLLNKSQLAERIGTSSAIKITEAYNKIHNKSVPHVKRVACTSL